MPDDRLIHRCAGHGERANQLTHLEYRVWTQYILSSDDFGVMRRTALTIQADNDALADEKPAPIERALLRLVSIALVVQFEHQKRFYICQLDWQTRQKIDYPRGTSNPKPPDSILEKCDELTRRLFDVHPGGKGRKKPDTLPVSSRSVHGTESEPKENILDYAGVGAREEANAKTNGSDKRLTANGSEGGAGETVPAPSRRTLVGSTQQYASFVAGFGVPRQLHEKLMGLCRGMSDGDADAAVRAFYAKVEADPRWAKGPIGESDVYRFIDARWKEEHGGSPARKPTIDEQNAAAWAEVDAQHAARVAKGGA